MKGTILVVAIAIATVGNPVLADDAGPVGRYQMVVVPSNAPGGSTSTMILDTATGDLWVYWVQPSVQGIQGSEGVRFVTRIRSGEKEGSVIYRRLFGG
jgi:hypothetical protein